MEQQLKITKEQILYETVRALSWKQPYASMMLNGKTEETRVWHTQYRGLVLMCASKNGYSDYDLLKVAGSYYSEEIHKLLGKTKDLPQGVAIAIGRLVNSKPLQTIDLPKAFVASPFDLYAHTYKNVTPIEPFPIKGKQGWWTLNDEVKALINPL